MSAGSITALVRTLVAVGATPDQILAAVETAEATKDAATEESRAKARARVKKWRDSQSETARNVTKRSVVDTSRLTRAEDSSSTSKISGKEKEPSPSARSKGTRIPDDFVPDVHVAIAEGLSRVDAEREARTFIDYWRARPGKEALKMDWPATWRVWFRKRLEAPRPAAKPPDKPPPRPRNVGELSHEQLLAPRTEIDVTDYSARRLEASNGRGLSAGAGDAKAFTVSGDFLGRI